MKLTRCTTTLFTLLGLCLTQVAQARPFPSHTIHGSEYASVCSPTPWKHLRYSLHQAAHGRNPQALVDLARTYLCGNNRAAAGKLYRNMPERIVITTESSGFDDRTSHEAPRTSLKPVAGAAWDAEVEPDGEHIKITYLASVSAATSVTFAASGSAWQLTAMYTITD